MSVEEFALVTIKDRMFLGQDSSLETIEEINIVTEYGGFTDRC